MKTLSAVNARASFRQVKIGAQMGFEVGKIDDEM